MKRILFVLMFVFICTAVSAQTHITGSVMGVDKAGIKEVLVGATLQWLGTKTGTKADAEGKFKLAVVKETNKLVVSYTGYLTDTLLVKDNNLNILLRIEPKQIAQVEVVAQKDATSMDYMSTRGVNIVSEKELFKAACCNLSESFETNPSIDVSFADAITGTKQIEMLGLAGIYTQTTLENMPYIRALTSNVGLTYVPGTWIQSINVSKGVGSVANGFESITGQIDIDIRKPVSEAEKTLFLNLYGSSDQRYEGNLNLRTSITPNLHSMTLLHVSTQQHKLDVNEDRFIDMPVFTTYNFMQRFHLHTLTGWEIQAAVQYVNDKKEGGTRNHDDMVMDPSKQFLYGTQSENLRLHGKTGYVFPDADYQSFGFQWSLSRYTNSSYFGSRAYDGKQESGYFNFLFQSRIGSDMHKYRTGISYMYDQYDETYIGTAFNRIERVPGVFFEYTYSPNPDVFSAVAGIRADYHNFYGMMITPRFHFRYAPNMDWVIRGVAGRGYRTSNIFAEYASVLASSRELKINKVNDFGYGLDQERGWNFGLNLTHYFYFEYREATISVDFYRTQFDKQTVADLDTNPQKVTFYTVEDGSFSNALQIELNWKPFENTDMRIAYRYLDVQQKISGEWMQRALQSKHRALVNVSYQTEKDNDADPFWQFDVTLQWFDSKRIPNTSSNPVGLRLETSSPGFILVNAQITKSFRPGLDFYVGGENLFDFRQPNPILDAANPNSQYFDASLIWGPVSGRMLYAGMRLRL